MCCLCMNKVLNAFQVQSKQYLRALANITAFGALG